MRINYKYGFILVVLLTLIESSLSAQEQDQSPIDGDNEFEQAFAGAGIGFDYGGLGIKLEFLPVKWLGVFAGVGYNLVDPAYNVGLSAKILPGKRVTPALMLLYGYNAGIKIKDGFEFDDTFSKTYDGLSTGAGVEVRTGRFANNKASFILMVPFRSSAFHNDYEGLKDAGYKFNPGILPIAISVGYSLSISSKLKR